MKLKLLILFAILSIFLLLSLEVDGRKSLPQKEDREEENYSKLGKQGAINLHADSHGEMVKNLPTHDLEDPGDEEGGSSGGEDVPVDDEGEFGEGVPEDDGGEFGKGDDEDDGGESGDQGVPEDDGEESEDQGVPEDDGGESGDQGVPEDDEGESGEGIPGDQDQGESGDEDGGGDVVDDDGDKDGDKENNDNNNDGLEHNIGVGHTIGN